MPPNNAEKPGAPTDRDTKEFLWGKTPAETGDGRSGGAAATILRWRRQGGLAKFRALETLKDKQQCCRH